MNVIAILKIIAIDETHNIYAMCRGILVLTTQVKFSQMTNIIFNTPMSHRDCSVFHELLGGHQGESENQLNLLIL